MNFCKNFNSKAVPCQDECMAYPCCEWPEIMETELDGTFYTELPAFRWPKRRGKSGKGAKEKRALACHPGNGVHGAQPLTPPSRSAVAEQSLR